MNRSNESNDEPNPKRPKMETKGSTSTKPKASDDPFLSLPSDILVKIIGYTNIAQWTSLELVDKNFRAATLIAWRQLRNVNLEREFWIKSEKEDDQTAKFVESILQKLVERSSFLTSLSGVDIRLNAASNPAIIQLLAKFEHLQSIALGDVKFINEERGILLEHVVEFLESTRSRPSLKDLKLYNVFQWGDRATILDQFAASFANGREIHSPLKLEKFSFTPFGDSLLIRLDNLDTTRLIELRVKKASIEPEQLTNLVGRASNLRRIEFSLRCSFPCHSQHLQPNVELLMALASHENLAAIRFGGKWSAASLHCTNFRPEFIRMLQSIGRRGQLRELALDEDSLYTTGMDEVCATIRAYIPYLQSIKLCKRDGMSDASVREWDGISDASVRDVVSLANLEEINFTNVGVQVTASTIEKIAQLSQLKRLALGGFNDENAKSLKYLANTKSLKDVRIRCANLISADILEKWADGIASNLEILMLEGIDATNEHNENGLIHILENAGRLRVLILGGNITDRVLTTIAKSCRELEILGVRSSSNQIAVQHLQEIVDRCTKLKRMGGFEGESHKQLLHFPLYQKIGDVDMRFWKYDFGDKEYTLD